MTRGMASFFTSLEVRIGEKGSTGESPFVGDVVVQLDGTGENLENTCSDEGDGEPGDSRVVGSCSRLGAWPR